METEKPFRSEIDVKKKRPVTWEISFFVIFVAAVFTQFIMSIAILASKNSDVWSQDGDDGPWTCPDGMVLWNQCGNVNSVGRRREIRGAWGRCVQEDFCNDLRECMSGGTSRRLSIAEIEAEAPSFEDLMQRIADDEHPPRALHKENAKRILSSRGPVAESVWDFLEEYPYKPAVLFGAVFVAAGIWLVILQQATAAAVIGIIVLDILMLIIVFFWWLIEFDVVNWACPILAVGMIVAAIILRKKISCAIHIMKTSMDGLAANKRIFLVCFGFQLLWVAYFALWVSAIVAIHFVVAVEYKPIGDVDSSSSYYPSSSSTEGYCEIVTGWPGHFLVYFFWIFMYYWVTYFFRNANLILITANLSGWYFNEPGYEQNWLTGIKWAFGPCAGGSAFCAMIMGACQYLVARTNNLCRIILSVMNPIDWIPLCLALCLKQIIITYTKYGVVAHVYSGLPFFQAAPKAFTLLKSRLGEAFITDYLGTRVMAWATYVISIGMAFAAWAWADDLQGYPSFSKVGGAALIFITFLYAYILAMPFFALILVIILEQFINDIEDAAVRALFNSIFASVFIGSITFFLLTYVSLIVVNAMDVVFFCYAIEMDNAGSRQERFEKLYESIKDSIAPGVADMQQGLNNGLVVQGIAPNGAAPATGQQTLAVTVPPGAAPGQTLQIQTPQGQTIQVQIPAGLQQGQTFNVQVQQPVAAPMAQVVGQPVGPQGSTSATTSNHWPAREDETE